MSALKRVRCTSPGISRRRQGRGFTYLHPNGQPVRDEATRERIRALAIPPAWEDVWICPDDRGHLQAVGTDAAGRRQYLYHEDWRARRDRQKFDRVCAWLADSPRCGESAIGPSFHRCQLTVVGGWVRPRPRVLRSARDLHGGRTVRRAGDDLRAHCAARRRCAVRFSAKGGSAGHNDRDQLRPLTRAPSDGRRGSGSAAFRSGTAWRDVRRRIQRLPQGPPRARTSSNDFRTWHAPSSPPLSCLAGGGLEPSRPQAGGFCGVRSRDALGNPRTCVERPTAILASSIVLNGDTIALPRAGDLTGRVRDGGESRVPGRPEPESASPPRRPEGRR